ncbi:MAG: Fic family protein [Candidatus Omnitrophota bacterium]
MWQPIFKINNRTLGLLEKITELRSKIETSSVKLAWMPSLIRDAVIRSAHGSTAIEGCTLSMDAVKSLFEGKKVFGYPEKHIRMAKNYIDAIQWVTKNEKKSVLLEKDIMQIHKIIAADAVDEGPIGEYRRVNVTAGIYSAPNRRQVPGLMKELLDWLNNKSKEIPAVFTSSLLHLQFVNIHPFRDGNGRCARALATWELYHRGFDTLHIFSLDEVLLENRNLYIKNLQRVQVEKYPLEAWLEFMSETILEALERVYSRILSTGITTQTHISLTLKQEKLLRILQERGIMSIRDIARAIRTTIPGAHYVLKPLIKYGVVVRVGQYKSVRYAVPSFSVNAR